RTNTHPASTGCSTLELHRITIQRRRQESNLLGTGLQPVAWPSSPGVGRASGESRTHTSRITGAVRCQLRHAGFKHLRQESNPVLDFRRVECVRHTPEIKRGVRSQESGVSPPVRCFDHSSLITDHSSLFTYHSPSTPAGSRTQTSTFGGSR